MSAASHPPPSGSGAWVESRIAGPSALQRMKRSLASVPALLPSLSILSMLASLDKEVIVSDVSAGIVTAIMLIPQALAYAQLAGAPLVNGYYASILSTAIYPLFGTSPHLAVGPVAIMSLLSEEGVASIIASEGEGHGSSARFVDLVSGPPSSGDCGPSGKIRFRSPLLLPKRCV
jgi:MFS superfamily sulfate permease-like transporter